MSKLLYDNAIFGLQNVGGASNYFSNLILQLRAENDIVMPPIYSNNVYVSQVNKNVKPQLGFPLSKYYYRYVNNKKSLPFIKSGKYDVFHHTYYDTYFLEDLPLDKPLIVTIHDMVHEKFSHLYKFAKIITNNKKELLRRADKIIAISEKTKYDLCELFGIDEEKVDIVYHGTDFKVLSGDFKVSLALPHSYILFIGRRGGYKNFEWMLLNLVKILTTRNMVLVCVGSLFTQNELNLIQQFKLSNLVQQIFAESNQELQEIYFRAKLFIYPSLYEGFGIPILEAFASKVPVLLSNCSCFPEIAGDAAVYFTPGNSEEFNYQVNLLLDQDVIRKDLIIKGVNRLQDFSWAKCAEQTAKIYRGVS